MGSKKDLAISQSGPALSGFSKIGNNRVISKRKGAKVHSQRAQLPVDRTSVFPLFQHPKPLRRRFFSRKNRRIFLRFPATFRIFVKIGGSPDDRMTALAFAGKRTALPPCFPFEIRTILRRIGHRSHTFAEGSSFSLQPRLTARGYDGEPARRFDPVDNTSL